MLIDKINNYGNLFDYFSFHQITSSIFDHIIIVGVFGFIALFKNQIVSVLRRTIRKTDRQIVTTWYVSRYQKKNNSVVVVTDKWKIKRGLTSSYWVKHYNENNRQWRTSGKLIYNERDRFNILLTGEDHRQQSLICFQTNIPRYNDSRILGIGVGDDSQYILSSRIYFASQAILPEEHIKSIIEDATNAFITLNQSPMIQLPTTLISEIFDRHPMPMSSPYYMSISQNIKNNFNKLVLRKS